MTQVGPDGVSPRTWASGLGTVLQSGWGGRAGRPPLRLQENVRLRVTLTQRHGKLRAGESMLTKFPEYQDAADRNYFFFLLSQFEWMLLSLLTHNVMATGDLIWAGFPHRLALMPKSWD